MAKLSPEDVLKLASLARLRLTPDEVDHFAHEIGEILDYVEQLGSVDISGLEPTYQVTGLTNVTRTDVVKDYGPTPEDLLKNAPAREGKYIKVRRMLG
jgi:aspartyl-tRNA(Asn)/glutamyl-tRNA(Gln) amidotransferase subunit C